MKKTCIVLLALAAAQLRAQPAAEKTPLQVMLNGAPVALAGQVVKGRPFSASEENRSTQMLANGTRIENKTAGKQYRDTDGRTRTEAPDGTITISDPVADFRATLNPKTKVANKTNTPVVGGRGVLGGSGDQLRPSSGGTREDLGTQVVNGVSARGERVTLTIPKGEIGNDRELKVVTERWTSEELQMLIKSTNTDPRYGDTAYELTGISLAAPSLTLFQIPPDYTVNVGRGGGAPAPAGGPGARSGAKGGKQQ